MVRLHPLCHTACHRMVCVSHGLLSQLTAWPNIRFVVRFVTICVFLIVTWIINELPLYYFWTVLLPLLVKSVKSLFFCGSLGLIYTHYFFFVTSALHTLYIFFVQC